jgi:hypothetical protein
MRGRETVGRSNQACPSHARSKCAASPCFRTFRNARTRYIRSGPPRRKSASRRPGSATGAILLLPRRSPLHYDAGNGGDCRYDRPDRASYLHPWKIYEKNTLSLIAMASSICGNLQLHVQSTGMQKGRLHFGAGAVGDQGKTFARRLGHFRGIAPDKKQPSPQNVDNPQRLGDNHT